MFKKILVFLILFFELHFAFPETIDTTLINPEQKQDSFKNFLRINYKDLISFYNEKIMMADYLGAIFYAKMAFAKATNTLEMLETLFLIASAYEKNGDDKEAKLIYRQVIENYSDNKSFVELAKIKLLAI
ncbi:MAG: tetratricopeptide repeat protein [Elusimicrobiota bacterium]|jgi:tetratricopeptide (TPR) repeat protein|nr:tetratricopeptide repeat protein [Elusimicrobiota bacterium]